MSRCPNRTGHQFIFFCTLIFVDASSTCTHILSNFYLYSFFRLPFVSGLIKKICIFFCFDDCFYYHYSNTELYGPFIYDFGFVIGLSHLFFTSLIFFFLVDKFFLIEKQMVNKKIRTFFFCCVFFFAFQFHDLRNAQIS